MKFESRKLYSHGQNRHVFLLQIPKLISIDMGLTKDSEIDVFYNETDKTMCIKKKEEKLDE